MLQLRLNFAVERARRDGVSAGEECGRKLAEGFWDGVVRGFGGVTPLHE